jgi:hypothetical protein
MTSPRKIKFIGVRFRAAPVVYSRSPLVTVRHMAENFTSKVHRYFTLKVHSFLQS